LLLVFAACSSNGPGISDAGTDAASDVSDASAGDTDGDASIDVGTDSDATSDAPEEHAPIACPASTACNERLDQQHLCRGECVSVVSGATCHGEVVHGLCFARPPTPYPSSVSAGGFELAIRDKPDEARVGDTIAVSFDVKNTSNAAVEARVGIKPGAKFTLLDTADFDAAAPLPLAAGASRTITAHVHAEEPSILASGDWSALDVIVADTPLDPRGLRVPVPVVYATGPRACGAHVFPEFNTEVDRNYGNAACCAGVFYPGAQCCADADCADGARCADGVCVSAAPNIAYSGSPLGGPQRVLIAFVDEPEPKPPAPRAAAAVDICADRAAERGAALELPLVADWFAALAHRRIGRALTDFRFTVLAGLHTQDFAPASNSPTAYGAALETFLVARGCTAGWARDFDRVIIVAPTLETGAHQGMVYAADRVAVQLWSAAIATHELAHTFGATDRYFDVGGSLQYAGALMSTVDRAPAELADTVAWSEVGLGDVDRDGVIDALAFSHAPERLVLRGVTAEARTRGRSLLLGLRLAAEEQGATLVVEPRAVRIDLVDAGVSTTLTIDGHRPGIAPADRDRFLTGLSAGAGRDLPDDAFDALVAAGKIKLRIRVDHAYTDAQFQRRVVSLDETRELDLDVTGNGNPGPTPGPLPQ
jgi:hypothetical protein